MKNMWLCEKFHEWKCVWCDQNRGGGACSSNRTSLLSATATVCNKQPVRKRRAWMSQTVWRGAVYKVPCQWESTLLGNRSIWCHFLLRGDGEVACPAGRRAEKSVWELGEQEAPDPLTDQNHTLLCYLGTGESIKNARSADLKVKTSTSCVNTSAVPRHCRNCVKAEVPKIHCNTTAACANLPFAALLFKVSNAHERWSLGHFCLRRLAWMFTRGPMNCPAAAGAGRRMK